MPSFTVHYEYMYVCRWVSSLHLSYEDLTSITLRLRLTILNVYSHVVIWWACTIKSVLLNTQCVPPFRYVLVVIKTYTTYNDKNNCSRYMSYGDNTLHVFVAYGTCIILTYSVLHHVDAQERCTRYTCIIFVYFAIAVTFTYTTHCGKVWCVYYV